MGLATEPAEEMAAGAMREGRAQHRSRAANR
jgi:hypothetical protein